MIKKDTHKIKIFAMNDEFLKELGDVLRNDTSRRIILAISEKEMIINEIASSTNLGVSLVINYMKKLKKVGIVDIKQKKITKKTKEHNFYSINTDIFLSLTDEPRESKLKRIFKDGVKFAALGFASLVTFSLSGGLRHSEFGDGDLPHPLTVSPLIYGMFVVIIGLLIFYFTKRKSKG